MEEILASIRQTISDEKESGKSAPADRPVAVAVFAHERSAAPGHAPGGPRLARPSQLSQPPVAR